jgi:hypothetical protein
MRKLELHIAYTWDCESCGRENFCRAVRPSLAQDEIDEMRLEHGIEEEDQGEWMMAPATVTCEHCLANYEVESVDGFGMQDGEEWKDNA